MEFAVHKTELLAQNQLLVHEGQAVVQEYEPVSSAQQHLSATHSNNQEYYHSADLVVNCLEEAAADLGNVWVVAGKHWSRFVLGDHQLVIVVGHRKAKADAVLGKAD